MEDGPQVLPPPATLEPISRPSSTSTQASVPPNLPQLPGISSLAAGASATSSPQLRATSIPAQMYSSSPASTVGPGGNLPTCQNCQTSTTPLWRRDEMGSVLCNACGLFLKLHGRPRPISLKTDVIKSRNRVKTMRPDLAKQKKNQVLPATSDLNGADMSKPSNGTPAGLGARRTSQKSLNGHADDTHSPVSRTATPNMYNPHGIQMYPPMDEAQFQTQSLAGFAAGSPGRAQSPMNGDGAVPQTREQLIAENASLKTRVSELEVIQELYRGRNQQLEQEAAQKEELNAKAEAQLRSQLDSINESESQLRKELDESHRRENLLKRRLDELELELKDAKESLEIHENGRNKKLRVDDMVEKKADATEPQAAS